MIIWFYFDTLDERRSGTPEQENVQVSKRIHQENSSRFVWMLLAGTDIFTLTLKRLVPVLDVSIKIWTMVV